MIDSAKPLSQVEINEARAHHDQSCLVCRSIESRICAVARLLATVTQQAVEIERLRDPLGIETAVGGSYQIGDGREFWIDAPVAREITRRALTAFGGPQRERASR